MTVIEPLGPNERGIVIGSRPRLTTAQIQRSIRAEIHVEPAVEETHADVEQEVHEAEHAAEEAGDQAVEAAHQTQDDIWHNRVQDEFQRLHDKIDQHHTEHMAGLGVAAGAASMAAEAATETGERLEELPEALEEAPAAEIEEVEQATPPEPESKTEERKRPKYRPGRH